SADHTKGRNTQRVMVSVRSLRRAVNPRSEDGVALILALAVLIFFSTVTVASVTMANSTQGTASTSAGQQNAFAYAEAGINDAESVLYAQNNSSGNPSAANLLGCA